MNLIKRRGFCVFAGLRARAGMVRAKRESEGEPLSPHAGRARKAKIQNPLLFKRGASLLETVLYIGIFAIITLLTVNTVLALTRAVSEIRSVRHIIQDSDTAMERMIREIRAAESIDTTASIFNTHPGKLVLANAPDITTFSFSDGKIFLQKNSESIVPIAGNTTVITNLIFTHFTTARSEAIRVTMTMDNKNFYGTAVLRTHYK